MSGSSTITASPSASQTVLGRPSSFRLPSPAVTVSLLIASVFLLRLPGALVPRELNPDESLFLSLAMKFLVDPRPWIAADLGSAGPVTSYLVSAFLWMGFKPGFVLVHMLATVVVCAQVLVAYLTLRRLGSEKTAALGAFLMVLFYGLATYAPDFLNYGSELLPTLLLMLGFYLFLVWLDEPAGRRAAALWLLFAGGLMLGTAPWCKLQAVPITGALGLIVIAAIFRDRGSSFLFSLRLKELVAFCAGAVLPTCVMLAILAKTGAFKDFWYSYILCNLAYAGPLSLIRLILLSVLVFLYLHFFRCYLWHCSVCWLMLRAGSAPFKKRKWAYGGLLVYAGAALFAVCRPSFFYLHYVIFLVPPITYLAAVLASPESADLTESRQSPRRLMRGLALMLIVATIGLYVTYAVRYVHMIRAMHELSRSQPDWHLRIAKVVPDDAETDSIWVRSIGPRHWTVEDSNERIAQVVRDIQKTHPVRSLVVWGWSPGVYVLTGIPPATRDACSAFQITKGPMQKYYQDRSIGDLRKNPPDLFIDAVAPDAFMGLDWMGWSEKDGYESDPQLQKFVEDNYMLVDELSLVEGAKPVRFFTRREPAAQPPR